MTTTVGTDESPVFDSTLDAQQRDLEGRDSPLPSDHRETAAVNREEKSPSHAEEPEVSAQKDPFGTTTGVNENIENRIHLRIFNTIRLLFQTKFWGEFQPFQILNMHHQFKIGYQNRALTLTTSDIEVRR